MKKKTKKKYVTWGDLNKVAQKGLDKFFKKFTKEFRKEHDL